MLHERDAILNARFETEPWGKLAVRFGLVPVNTESGTREALRLTADYINMLIKLLVRVDALWKNEGCTDDKLSNEITKALEIWKTE